MKILLFGVLGCLFLASCGEKQELTSSETRAVTTLDERPIPLSPTSADRFEPPGTPKAESTEHVHGESAAKGGFTYTAGEGWTAKPKTQFRLVNYVLPAGGEIYLSITGGGVLPNLNRWLGQFGQEKISESELAQMPTVTILGEEGVLVEVTGAYAGMGKSKQDNMSLLGTLAEVDGQLISVKLIATPDETKEQKAAFITFCESLAK